MRHCILLVCLALYAFLAAGCRSHAPRSSGLPSEPALAPFADARFSPIEPEPDTQAQAHAHYAAGVIHDLNSEPGLAMDEYVRAAQSDLANEELILEVSRRLLQARQTEKALDLLNRAVQRPDASGVLWARKGLICSQLGRGDEAAAANREAIRRSPQLLAGYQNLFASYLQAKREPEALAVLNEAATQPDVPPEFLIALAELYWNLGVQAPAVRDEARAKAKSVLERASELPIPNPAMRVALAEQWFQLGDTENAAKVYLEVLKTLSGTPGLRDRVHARLSEIYLRAQDLQKATEQLQALVKADPANPMPHYFLGAIAMEQRKPAEAVDHLSRTVLLKPDFEQAYYDLANAQISSDKSSDALATLDEARKRFQESFVSEFLRAVAFTRQKAYEDAVRKYTAAEIIARATDPKRLNHFFHFQFGAACERKGDYAEAEKHFTRCIELAPDFSEALNYLGYMWAEQGTNLARAKELIEKALKAEPKNGAYLDSLGWVLHKMGDHAQALTYIQQAIEVSAEPDATLFDHLGDIYAALGDKSKAREAWRKSLEVEENAGIRRKLGEEPPAAVEPAPVNSP